VTRGFDLNITWSRVSRGHNTAIGDVFATEQITALSSTT
jgi:hypothetical protein